MISTSASEWPLKRLKDITSKIGSGATPRGGKNGYRVEGISLIRSLNVYDFSFTEEGLAFIGDEQAAELDNVQVGLAPRGCTASVACRPGMDTEVSRAATLNIDEPTLPSSLAHR